MTDDGLTVKNEQVISLQNRRHNPRTCRPTNPGAMSDDAFYLRYYVGHKDGDFGGVEYMEVSYELLFQIPCAPRALEPN